MQVIKEGSVRVDLAGGTLDIPPINLIIKNVVTLNLATSLKAKVILTQTPDDGVEIISHDYDKKLFFKSSEFTSENIYFNNYFKELTFIVQILDLFEIRKNLKIELMSGAPAGSGLGGSSSMGATLYSALCEFNKVPFDRDLGIKQVNMTEGRILNCGMPGYQDYYPALYGGILALHPSISKIKVEQYYDEKFAHDLTDHMTLVFSGESRLSGINNWEVYKAFFDRNEVVVQGLTSIANISFQAYQALKAKDCKQLIHYIGLEGEERRKLFPKILTPSMEKLKKEIDLNCANVGMKVCGAGGGGCFLLVHSPDVRNQLKLIIENSGMKILPFAIEKPLP